MLRFPEHHGVDVSAFLQLRLTDFWLLKEECEEPVTYNYLDERKGCQCLTGRDSRRLLEYLISGQLLNF